MPSPNQGRASFGSMLGCFRQKLSCRTGGAGRQKKAAEEKDANDEGSDGSGKQWMLKFSTMKVGPPKQPNLRGTHRHGGKTPQDSREGG